LDKLKHILLLAFLTVNTQLLIAQENSSLNESKSITTSVNERIFIHSNATTFVTGETMYYKLYCLNSSNNTPSTISKIAYVELIESNRQNVITHKLYLERGTGQGDFFIPTTLKTGNYKLIAYTNWMLNKSIAEIFQLDISIINPFQIYEKDNSNVTTNIISLEKDKTTKTHNLGQQSSFENKNFSLELNKKTFSNREQVALQIKSLTEIPEKGNYSLSVRKVEDLPSRTQLNAKEFINNSIGTISTLKSTEKEIILPELRGEMITGTIVSKKESNDVSNKTVALSIPGKSYAFKLANTNQSGKFIFNLDKVYYSSNIIIQVLGDDRKDFTINLNKSNTVDYSLLPFQNNLKLTSDIKHNLEERSIASQIENAYYDKKKDSIAKTAPINSFFNSLGKEYILDDFTRFQTLKETIIEVVFEMYFKQENNNYSLFLRDYKYETELQQPSLVLVDGLLVEDINELFDYKTDNIYKISIVPGGYYYGPKLFNGIINFTTKNNDFISKAAGDYILKLDNLRPFNKKTYYKQDYVDPAKFVRIPDYRYQLLWTPELTIENKENSISFYTSDVAGIFEIALEGFTDKGIPISLKETIEVK
jgi:hypothetical protein